METAYEINLEQILTAREKRSENQKKLLEKYKKNLVCFTVNIPGAKKRTSISLKVFDAGCQSIIGMLQEKNIKISHKESKDLITGPEAYVVVDENERTLKEHLIEIEDKHPLGRLFDFDVIRLNGTPVSRQDMGESPRKCLLCGLDAHVCSRNKTHSLYDLTIKIDEIVNSYLIKQNIKVSQRVLCVEKH